jgi:hypothetical protein
MKYRHGRADVPAACDELHAAARELQECRTNPGSRIAGKRSTFVTITARSL